MFTTLTEHKDKTKLQHWAQIIARFKKILEKLTRNESKRSITRGQAGGYEDDRYYNIEGGGSI